MILLLRSLRGKLLFAFLILLICSVQNESTAQSVTIGTGATGNSNTYGPLTTTASQPRTIRIAYIYPSSLLTGINNGDFITSLEYFRSTASGTLAAGSTWKIYVKNTTQADWGSGSLTWTTGITGATLVFNGDPSAFVGSAAGARKVDFTTNHIFNTANGNNLAILIEHIQTTVPTSAITYLYDGTASVPVYSTNQVKYSTTTTAVPPTTLATSSANHPQLKINFSYNLNASLSKLISPVVACAGTTDSVRVQLKNAGFSNITSAAINWTYNGVAQTPYNYTGTLLKDSVKTISLGQQTYTAGQPVNIKAWVASANGITDEFAGDDTLRKNNTGPALSGTYTIGGVGADYADMVTAVNDLNQRGVCGAVTFNVDALSGPYSGQLKLDQIPGASAINTITFNGNGATIIDTISSTESATRYIVYLNGTDYTTINNFTITYHSSSTYGVPVMFGTGANYNTVKNCTLLLDVNTSSANYMGLVFTADPTATVAAASSYNVIENNTIKGGTIGIGVYGSGATCRGNIFRNNIIEDSYSNAMFISGADSTQIVSNDISRPTRITYTTGQGIQLTGNSLQVMIEKNRIHDVYAAVPVSSSGYNAIYVTGNDAKPGKEVIVRNNLIYNFRNNGQHVGLYNNGSDSVWYYHNTVVFDYAGATGGAAMGLYMTVLASGVKYMNNNVYVSKGGNGNKYAVYVNTTGITHTINYNNLYVDTNIGKTGLRNIGYYATANFITLANWKTANSGAYDQNSVSANPIFANALNGDFTPNTFTINNIGTPLAAVPQDFNGATRDPLNPDPGAYEFTPIADDAGIIATSLVTGTCAGNTMVTATLKNSGANNLTGVQVNWSVNGVLQTPLSYSGTLTPGKDTVLNLGNYSITLDTIYNVLVWSLLPNGNPDNRTSNDTLKKLNFKSAMVGTYTAGGAGADYATISSAALDLAARGVCGPVTISVNPSAGPYTEQVRINPIAGTSAVNTVTFSGHGAAVNFTSNSSVVRYGFYIAGASYVTIDSFAITSATGLTNYGWGIQVLSGSNYNTIKNNIIKVSDTVSATGDLYGGIIFSNSLTTFASGGRYLGNIIENNKINGGIYGISIYGTSGSNSLTKGNKILNNTITNSHTNGIYVYYQDSTQIVGNDISRATRLSTGTYAGIYANSLGNSTRIEKNQIHNVFDLAPINTSTVYGIYLSTSHHTPGKEGLVANNLIYNFSSNGSHYGLHNTGSGYVNYYHNTIVMNNPNATAGATYLFYQTTIDSFIVIKNNIFSVTRGGTGTKYGIYCATSTSKITSNNNVFNIKGPAGTNNIGYWASAAKGTLALWQAAYTAAPFDMASVVADPWFLFPSGNNFKPNAAPVNNIGASFAGVTTDITGAARGANPDPGAYEFTPNQNDVAIVAYNSPLRTCPGTNNVLVTIKNFGTNALTALTVNWTLNGIAQSPFTFAGFLPTGEDSLLNIGSFVSALSATYNVKVWSSQPNGSADQNPLNDSIAKSNILAGMIGTFTIGGATADYQTISSAVSDLSARGVCGNVVFDIDPSEGPYIERVRIPVISGASAASTITFKGNGAQLRYLVTSSTERSVFLLNGADYIIVDSLDIDVDPASTYGFTFVMTDSANHNIIRNCKIATLRNTSSANYNPFTISAEGSPTAASNCRYNIIENNTMIGGNDGITLYGLSGSNMEMRGNIIRNNKVEDFYDHGIYVMYGDSTIVSGNDVSRPTQNMFTTTYGIYFAGVSQNLLVENNRIHHLFTQDPTNTSSAYCLYFGTGAAQSGKTSVVRNNVIYNIDNNGIHYNLYNSTSGNVQYYHNTVSDDAAGRTTGTSYGFYQTGSATGIEIKNNIFNITKGATREGIHMVTAGTPLVSNFNNFWVPGGSVGYNTNAKTTLGAWQAVANQDLNSDTLNPNFVYALSQDYSPANLALDNRGTNLGVLYDINGTLRSPSSPDMGAYEFTPIADDAAVTVLGFEGICPGLNNIKVRVKNLGVSTLTAVYVNWTVNGVNQLTYNFSGNLGQGQDTLLLLGTYNFVAANPYNLKFWTSLPNGNPDGAPLNDTLRVNGIKTGLSGTYTIGGAGADYPNITAAVNAMSSGICGPVVFNVNPAAGPYNEQVIIPAIANASAASPVIFKGHGSKVTFSPTVSSARHIIKLKGADYVTIDSFTVEVDPSATYGFAMQVMSGSNNNTIKNCAIVTVNNSTSTNFSALVFSNSETAATGALTDVSYNTVENNVIIGGYYGLSLYGTSTNSKSTKGNIFRNNRIEDVYLYPLYTLGCDSTIISGNDISRPSRSALTTFNGIYLSTNSYRFVVEKNRIHNPFDGDISSTSAFYGIYTASSDGKSGQESVIKNNLIYNVNGAGAQYGMANSGSDSIHYFHNTIVLNDNAGSTAVVNGFLQTSTTASLGLKLFNNLYFINRPGTGNRIGMYWTAATSTYESNYNNFYISNAGSGVNAVSYDDGNYYNTILDWQAASGNTYDQNSYAMHPLFNQAVSGSYRPFSGGLDNKGFSIPSITTDIMDSLRSPTNPDIGAYEFTAFGEDAGIVSLGFPPACAGLNTVSLIISNSSANALTTLDINWSVNGVMQAPYAFSGAIFSGQSGNVQIGTYSFAQGTSYTLKFWTSNPNFQADANTANDTFLVNNYRTALNGNYTVGGVGSDFANLTALASYLNTNGVCGPVVINLNPAASPFNEQVMFDDIPGTSAVNRIKINGHQSIVSFAPTTTEQRHVLQLNGTKYMTIDSLQIILDPAATYGHTFVMGNNANYDTIRNCNIKCIQTSSTNYSAFVIAGTAGSVSTAANSKYNVIENNTVSGGYYCMSIYGTSGSNALTKGNIFRNNKIKDYYTYGLYHYYADSTHIIGNDFSRATATTVGSGYGIYVAGLCQDLTIEKNRIHNLFDIAPTGTSTSYCIYLSTGAAQPGRYNIVKNNVIYNINNNGTHYYIYNTTSGNALYYHNTVISDYAASTAGAGYGFYQTGSATGIELKNNIFVLTRGGSGVKEGIHMVTATTPLVSNYNCFYVPGGSVGYNSVARTTLADWQAVAQNDTNSVVADPVFTYLSTHNISPTSAVMDNKGTPLFMVPEDITGAPRHATTPDVGAYEFSPVNNDLSISNILYPVGNVCGLPTDSVVVVLKNLGALSQSAFNIKVDITGAVNTTLTKTYTPSFASGDVDTITIGYYNSNVNGNTSIKVYTQLAADQYALNDTSKRNITLSQAAVQPTASGTSVCRGSQALLVANTSLGIVRWYDAPAGGNLLTVNDSLTTPVINNNTTFYVEAADGTSASFHVGALNTAIGTAANFTDPTVQYMEFTALSTFTLDSVWVYPNAAGTVGLRILSSTGTVLQTATATVSAAQTLQRIYIGLVIPPGTYRMDGGGSTTGGLWRNQTGAVYPYTVPGIVSITGNSFDPAYFYYFYNWRVTGGTVGCPSPRLAVNVNTLPELAGSQYAQSTPFDGLYKTGNVADPDGACAGDVMTYDIAPPNTFTVAGFGSTWNIDNVTIKTSHNANPAGTFTVTGRQIKYQAASTDVDSTLILTVRVKDMSGSICDTVMKRYIHVSPVPDVDLGLDTTLCDGQVLTLDAGPGFAHYQWSNGDTTQTTNVTASGNYTVTVSNAGGCTDADVINATFSPSPTAILPNDTAGCGSVILDAGNPGATYLWSTGETTRTINVTASGPYHVRVTGSGTGACFRDDTTQVTVNVAPLVDLGLDQDICTSDTITLDAENPGSTYLWSTGATTQTIRVSNAGKYKVTVTNPLGCSTIDSVTITNKAEPIANFNVSINGLTVTYTVPAQTGMSYNWKFGDNTTSAQPNPAPHIYPAAGTYTVTLTVTNVATGCKATFTQQVTVSPQTGVGTETGDYLLKAYPNPFTNKTFISFELPKESEVTLEIYDVIGKKITTLADQQMLSGEQKYEWQTTSGKAGVYFVRLTIDHKVSILRLVNIL